MTVDILDFSSTPAHTMAIVRVHREYVSSLNSWIFRLSPPLLFSCTPFCSSLAHSFALLLHTLLLFCSLLLLQCGCTVCSNFFVFHKWEHIEWCIALFYLSLFPADLCVYVCVSIYFNTFLPTPVSSFLLFPLLFCELSLGVYICMKFPLWPCCFRVCFLMCQRILSLA